MKPGLALNESIQVRGQSSISTFEWVWVYEKYSEQLAE